MNDRFRVLAYRYADLSSATSNVACPSSIQKPSLFSCELLPSAPNCASSLGAR